MKPFLGVNVTTDAENTTQDSSEFLIEKTPDALCEKLDDATTRMSKAIKKSQLHPFWQVVHWLSGLLALIFGGGVIGSVFFGTFMKGIKNAPWVHILGFGSIIIWAIITFFATVKKNKVLSAKESIRAKDDALSTFDTILDTLDIPDDAVETDILCCQYKIENGVPKMNKNVLGVTSSIAHNYRIFRDSDNLYLASPEGKYAFPLRKLRTIRTINEEAAISGWHKEKSYESDEYKPYGVFTNQFGILCVPGYHALEVEGQRELMWICFPNYEIKTFEAMTNLKAWGV